MTPEERKYIYTLLAAVILVDQRIRTVEIETFIELILGFQTALRDPNAQSKDQISGWFHKNRETVIKLLNAPDRNGRLAALFNKLDGFVFKTHLLAAMESIAVSDKELHESEVDIMQMAADYWNLPIPHPV